MTRETLDKLRSMGMNLGPQYDILADKLTRNRLETDANKELTIKYHSYNQDDTLYYIKFEVTSKNLKNKNTTISLYEYSKTLWSDNIDSQLITLDKPSKSIVFPILKTKIKTEEVYFLKVSCDGEESETGTFSFKSENKTSEHQIIEPKKIKDKPLNLNNKQKIQFITVALGETQNGDKNLWDIVWIYFNLIKDIGFDKAMKRSSFFNNKPDNYKLFMFLFGEGSEFENDKMDNGNKIKDWVTTDYFKNGLKKKGELFKLFIEDNVLIPEPINPFYNWEGQGYWADLNLLPPKNNEKWYKARLYYWLQVEKNTNIKYKYIQILEDGFSTSFIFDEKSIIKFFKENPKLIPKDLSNIKTFYYEKD